MSNDTQPRRGMRIALILSLGLNLLILGALLGLVVVGAGRVSDGAGPGLRAVGLGPILPLLAAEDRVAMGERLRENRSRFGEQGRTLGQAVRGLSDALRSEPFDRAAAEVALTAQRAHGAALQEQGHELLLDHFDTMSAEARTELADRLERAMQRAVERRFGSHGAPRD